MATSKIESVKEHSSGNTSGELTSGNLESFVCLWLDQNVNATQDNQDTHQELRQVINHLRIFHDSDECEQYIQQIIQEKVVLIVSGGLGRQIVPRLHDLLQLSACYVFCQDKKANEQWASKYHKVNGVFVKRAELVAQISKDQIARTKVEDGAAISVISSGTQSLQARNAIFMWFQLFIEVLLRMHHKSSDRKELIDICKTSYKGNTQEMTIIDEFEKNYQAENAIWWYTRESCFYRMMNKALRVQDFDMLFAFRFFITDIAKQIKNDHEKFIRTSDTRNVIRVYRGQAIATDELEMMKKSVGDFLSMNSFLSTSRDRSTALHFARLTSVTNGIEQIIFEIEIDPRSQTKPFADITQTSYFQRENEILIVLGALFRIEQVSEDKQDRVWVVRVSLAREDDFHLKETFAYMKGTIEDDTDLDSLGKILFQMGEYDQSQKCYERMMHDLQVKTGNCHMGLGKAKDWQNEYKSALVHYNQAMKIRQEELGSEHHSVGEVYMYIGALQWFYLDDYDEALVNLKKAIAIQEQALPRDDLALSRTYNNIAVTYERMAKYELAEIYYKKCLKIQQAVLPANHPRIAATYNNLGSFYDGQSNYTKALEYYRTSLSIKRQILPPTHEDIIRTENNIRRAKDKMKN